MKHLKTIYAIFIITLLSSLNLHAQSSDSSSIAQYLRSKLSTLNTSKTYTGYLYNQAPQSISPALFNGVDIDSLRPDAYGFRSLILQHQSANINNPDDNSLYNRLDSINTIYQSQGVVAINILNFAYDNIRYDALDSGYVQWNSDSSLLTVGPDTTHSPFNGFNVFAAAPWYGSLLGLDVKFAFPSALFISNLSNTIQSIEFQTEGTLWQTVNAGQVIELKYYVLETHRLNKLAESHLSLL